MAKTAKKATAPKAAQASKAAKVPNKSEFVRSLPADMPAGDVVAKAAAAGLKLSAKHVYVIRSLEKKRAAKAAGGSKPAGKPAAAKPARNGKDKGGVQPAARTPRASNGHGHDVNHAFRALVLQVGLVNAKAMIASIETA